MEMENLLTTNKEDIPKFLSRTIAPDQRLLEKWNELIGVEQTKQMLLTQIKLALSPNILLSWYQKNYNSDNPELPRYDKRTLLLGPSGTGKTSHVGGVADAYAREMGEEVYFVELGLVRSKYVGKTSQNIHKAFERVKEWSKEHTVIFLLDELDSLANPRNFEQMHEEIRDAVNTLIKEMDRLDSEQVFLIACSNLEGNIDEAVRRRFAGGLILKFTRPDYYQRKKLLGKWLGSFNFSKKDIIKISRKTKDRTHADIQNDIKRAIRNAFSEDKSLSFEHILSAIEEVKPTEDY